MKIKHMTVKMFAAEMFPFENPCHSIMGNRYVIFNVFSDSLSSRVSSGEHKSPEVVALNPRGQVPTFVDQGVAVHESMAILQYLENVYPEPPLIPSDRAEKGQVRVLVYDFCGED